MISAVHQQALSTSVQLPHRQHRREGCDVGLPVETDIRCTVYRLDVLVPGTVIFKKKPQLPSACLAGMKWRMSDSRTG